MLFSKKLWVVYYRDVENAKIILLHNQYIIPLYGLCILVYLKYILRHSLNYCLKQDIKCMIIIVITIESQTIEL